MTMIAYAFPQHQHLEHAQQEKTNPKHAPQPTLPAIRSAVINALSHLPGFKHCLNFRMRIGC
jgi:hypothetical protein